MLPAVCSARYNTGSSQPGVIAAARAVHENLADFPGI